MKYQPEMGRFVPITISILESFENKEGGATILCVNSRYSLADQKNNKSLTIIGDKSFAPSDYLSNINNWDRLLANWHISADDLDEHYDNC